MQKHGVMTGVAVLVACVTAGACGGPEQSQAPAPDFRPTAEAPASGTPATPVIKFDAASPAAMVTDMANGWPIALQVGQEVVVRLAANKTTGFSWVLTSGADGGVVAQQGEMTYEAAPTGTVGAGGTETYRFKGANPGEVTLAFAYRRPVEKDEPPARTVAYPITVK